MHVPMFCRTYVRCITCKYITLLCTYIRTYVVVCWGRVLIRHSNNTLAHTIVTIDRQCVITYLHTYVHVHVCTYVLKNKMCTSKHTNTTTTTTINKHTFSSTVTTDTLQLLYHSGSNLSELDTDSSSIALLTAYYIVFVTANTIHKEDMFTQHLPWHAYTRTAIFVYQ